MLSNKLTLMLKMKRPFFFLHAILTCITTIPNLVMPFANITTDQSALIAFKSQLSLDPSHSLSVNWSNSTSICNWIGVTCGSRHRRVTTLDLSSMEISGSLPPQIGNLSFLVSLNLSVNNFNGYMPTELTRLRRLRVLDFHSNNLTGDIPAWFSFMPRLQMLNLGNNGFTGLIPVLSNMSNLEDLDLSLNALHGRIPIEFGNFHNLKTLNLSFNELSDSIPSTLFNISRMERLDLRRNSLYGNLPENMCNGISRIEVLQLGVNDFNGEIPTNLSGCSRLEVLSLASNHFAGSIPRSIGNLRKLEGLYLGNNNLTGEIPDDLSNITTLRILELQRNQITGPITATTFNISSLRLINCEQNNLFGMLPADMCSHLNQLQEAIFTLNNLYGPFPTRLTECTSLWDLNLSANQFTGNLPIEIGNLTLLRRFFITGNNLTGEIPQEISNLVVLEQLSLSGNNFNGSIPMSIFNISTLRQLYLAENRLVGNIPSDLGLRLPNLERLYLDNNDLTSASPELSFITSLTNCRNLTDLGVAGNPLNSIVPPSIGNMSTSMEYLYMYASGLRGNILREIGNLTSLVVISISLNNFTSTTIPRSFGNLASLQGLYLSRIGLHGTIPSEICEMESLNELSLNTNDLQGSIPPCLGIMTTLRDIDLSRNSLNSTIPVSLWRLRNLLVMDLSSNTLVGSLPVEVGIATSLTTLDISWNQLTGTIPIAIGNLVGLVLLSLAHNRLQGSIPETVSEIPILQLLDLSHNNLSGRIPSLMENLTYLIYLNVSFNNLSGEIPSSGPFVNFTYQSFMFNEGLCGDARYNVTPCRDIVVAATRNNWRNRIIYIALGAAVFIIVIVVLAYVFARRRLKRSPNISETWLGAIQERVSYYELLEATDRYNESNLLGTGSFGSVYKGTLKNGKVVAVKVFHQQTDGAFDSFEAECEVLKNLRHRNLCKVIGCCSNEEFKALILDYMPNGSLENLLYSTNASLDSVQRISIMIDVASALEYLHHGDATSVVHCDLKPSNILLDEDLVAHLCDFGLAKLLGDGESVTQTFTLATLGYIAPEFGQDGRVSVKSDVYSYGITLMEVFTGRKPTDEDFTGDSSLRSWVEDSITGDIVDIIDPFIIHELEEEESEERSALKLSCCHSVMELALRCSSQSPHDRISIKDATSTLKKIQNKLL